MIYTLWKNKGIKLINYYSETYVTTKNVMRYLKSFYVKYEGEDNINLNVWINEKCEWIFCHFSKKHPKPFKDKGKVKSIFKYLVKKIMIVF
jgi:hypothetical protein